MFTSIDYVYIQRLILSVYPLFKNNWTTKLTYVYDKRGF